MKPQTLTILGATGSIGASTLSVVRAHPHQFNVFALTACSNVEAMYKLCMEFNPEYAVMVEDSAAFELTQRLRGQSTTQVLVGEKALCQVSRADEVDQVMAAIVGAAGLSPTLAAVNAGKRVLLANKEALVMSGQLFIDAVRQSGAQLLPVDSEHNAIFQCLTQHAQAQLGHIDLAAEGVNKIILTGSGGPFLTLPKGELCAQTPDAACKHPNWSMGQKISVDSATMLNKGLEYIEARWLFNCKQEQLDILIHPQSIVHSMVQYQDGSVLAQLGPADMRTPIAHCMHYPSRSTSGVTPLDFTTLSELTFVAPDFERFPCLQLAQQACWDGQAATTVLNASNEIAVQAFLNKRLSFTQIAQVCDLVLQSNQASELNSIDDIIALDKSARQSAEHVVKGLA